MADDLLPLLGVNMGNGDGDEDDEEDVEEDMMDDVEIELNVSDEEEDIPENRPTQKQESKKFTKKTKRQQSIPITFDSSLPTSHSYLGSDLEDVRGRTILDDDSLVTLPIIQLPGMVLIPGQTIPLHLFHQHTVAMIKGVVDTDKTFGVVAYRHTHEEGAHTMATIGTTAEIFSVRDETDDNTGLSTMRVKAKGRQRFHIVDTERSPTGILIGKVKILPEKVLPDCLEGARPPSHCKFCCPSDQDSVVKTCTAVDRQGNVLTSVAMVNKRQINKFTAACFTWWPPWVYKMYDAELVMQRTKEELHKWNETFRPENMPQDAVELSYWVTQNLPLDDGLRVNLLSIDSAVQRLRCALSIIEKCSILCCKGCGYQVANKNDVFSLSIEGPLGAYVNPGGYVHETMTVHKAQNLNLIGRPSTEHSWFPGYAWTIAQCRRCNSHMGWKFTSTMKELKPQKFWGLTRSSVVPGLHNLEESDEDWMPVM
ncbi:protein cereblon-like [Ylistrum balloti]|uniref:protein cereblon-like n=1 Tax=Ylistrum balloti TaxID=509963 RepID=UPI002905BA68|nr:protein cereblon-like [Ylistrum balloti]